MLYIIALGYNVAVGSGEGTVETVLQEEKNEDVS